MSTGPTRPVATAGTLDGSTRTRGQLVAAPPPRIVATLARSDDDEEDTAVVVERADRHTPERFLGVEPTEHIAASLSSMAGTWAAPSWSDVRRPVRAPVTDGAVPEKRTGATTDREQQAALVLEVLRQITKAYEQFDVQAAKAVWPTVDVRALRRAFHGMDAQQYRFTSCDVVSMSGEAANAHCRGELTYRPKVGSGRQQTSGREWSFDLSRRDDSWHIVKMTAQ